MMNDIIIYTTRTCPYCIRAKRLLVDLGLTFKEIAVDFKPKLRAEMEQKSGRRTVPQIWINGEHIGGASDLFFRYEQGTLPLHS